VSLNVIEQAVNVSQTTIVQNAWAGGQELIVHGWIYDLHDGLIRDLNITLLAASRSGLLIIRRLPLTVDAGFNPIRQRTHPHGMIVEGRHQRQLFPHRS
jgi:hypothetical protein